MHTNYKKALLQDPQLRKYILTNYLYFANPLKSRVIYYENK